MARLAAVDLLEGAQGAVDGLVLRLREVGFAVENRDGEHAAGNAQRDGVRVELLEVRHVQRRRGDQQTQLGALRQKSLTETEEDVRIDASLVRLVEHDYVVAREFRVADELLHQAAVRDVADFRGLLGKVVESDGVPDLLPQLHVQLFRDATSQVDGCHAARLTHCHGSIL